jgi:hypothetical protein
MWWITTLAFGCCCLFGAVGFMLGKHYEREYWTDVYSSTSFVKHIPIDPDDMEVFSRVGRIEEAPSNVLMLPMDHFKQIKGKPCPPGFTFQAADLWVRAGGAPPEDGWDGYQFKEPDSKPFDQGKD